MPIRLIIFFLSVLLLFLYITFLNPAVITFVAAPGVEVDITISVAMMVSFIVGVLAVMIVYFKDAFLDVIAGARRSSSEKRRAKVRELYESGAERLLVERRKEARKLFARALSADPDHVPSMVAFGKLQRENGEPLSAIETHSRARGLDDSNISNLLELAEDYILADKPGAAVSVLKDTRALAKKSLQPLIRIRDIYINARNWEEALNTQRDIVPLAKGAASQTQKHMLISLIYEVGVDLLSRGETQRARDLFKSVISSDSLFIPAHLKLAEAEDMLGWSVDALRILEKGFKATKSILILKALSGLLFSRGDGEKAVAKIKWAKGVSASNPVISLFLAEAYMREEDFPLARQEVDAIDGKLDHLTLLHLIEGKIRQGENNIDQAMESFGVAYTREAMTLFRFVCRACNNASAEYHGRCKACGEWNSLNVELG